MTVLSTVVEQAIAGIIAAAEAAISPDPTLGGAVPGGVAVFDGVPRAGAPESAHFLVSGWQITSREPAAFGAPQFFSIEEQFDLTGIIWAFEGSSDQSVSRTQATTIFKAVEAQVRTDPTLGGAVQVSWFIHHAGSQGPVQGQGGNATEIEWSLHCEAWIS